MRPLYPPFLAGKTPDIMTFPEFQMADLRTVANQGRSSQEFTWEETKRSASPVHTLILSETPHLAATPLQYSCLENPMDRGAWWAAVHGVTRSRTRLSDFTLFFHFHALEKEMATHSNVLAWRIPGTGEPGGLPSVGLHRVGHDWSDLAVAAAA